jgi:hypothetical protein
MVALRERLPEMARIGIHLPWDCRERATGRLTGILRLGYLALASLRFGALPAACSGGSGASRPS